ncbi:DUF6571 family protein [Streptomyces liangshanensis]|uniref:Uncharacterized protein n=1 Tax=Streptomyces liangshanensis TaxID=2717324 RepID=A0A6G9GWH7_9ACTN|nr:DUF6571 family protein [Streptomyces liangshanensis]QIQ02361.1 hypothetical protein HA039_08610 [Streptomyces liangshanensis]
MDLDALRFGNFSPLGEAITDWRQMVTKLEALRKDAQENLKAKADKANWAGVNAQVSRTFIDKTAGEFADARTQADTIAKILADTHGELVSYRNELNLAIERGLKKNLTVLDTGNGSFTVTMNIHPDRAAKGTTVPEHGQQDVDALRDEVQRILGKATESDNTAAQALRLIVDQADYGFSDASYADRDSAAAAVKAADDLAKILKKNPHDVTNTELNQLNSTLATYKNDPLFAEKFATDVGPKRMLEFYAGIADPYMPSYDPERGELAKQFQKNLGITLGTATLSDSDTMQEWERQMVKLGPDPLGIDDANDPRGFAVMSNLMRFGDYDDQFLNDYGDKLVAFDKEHNVKDPNPWINNWNQGDLNYWGKNDRGRDPMTGFLEALGHNPDASTQFFAQPGGAGDTVDKDSEVNDHLKYLTKERIWLSDTTLDGDHKVVAGRDSLGHALEAATTGYSYDATSASGKDPLTPGNLDHRTAETAGVMEQVAYLYGGEDGPKMLHDQPELADSLGKMGSAYIDDIDYGLSGIGDHAKDAGDFPARYAGRADFGNQGAINFLSVLGQNETSHGIVTAGQHIYTLSLLDANPPTDQASYEHGKDALFMEAEARGILDHARVQQAETDFAGEAEEANKSLGRSADWGKFAAGAIVGGGIAAIPLPGTTAVGIVVAPIAADMAGEALNTFIGQETDKAVDKAESDSTAKAQLTSQQFYRAGTDNLGDSYAQYFDDSAKYSGQADSDDVVRDLKTTYLSTGSDEDDLRGRPPYKD